MSLRSDAKTVADGPWLTLGDDGTVDVRPCKVDAALRLARLFTMERPVAVEDAKFYLVCGHVCRIHAPDVAGLRYISRIEGGAPGWDHAIVASEWKGYATEADALTAHQCDLADKFERDWQAAEARKLGEVEREHCRVGCCCAARDTGPFPERVRPGLP